MSLPLRHNNRNSPATYLLSFSFLLVLTALTQHSSPCIAFSLRQILEQSGGSFLDRSVGMVDDGRVQDDLKRAEGHETAT